MVREDEPPESQTGVDARACNKEAGKETSYKPLAREEDSEEEDMVEYVLMDLGSELHGAELNPGGRYTLSGLDTENPILELENGVKLIGHYEEGIGSYLILKEEKIGIHSCLEDGDSLKAAAQSIPGSRSPYHQTSTTAQLGQPIAMSTAEELEVGRDRSEEGERASCSMELGLNSSSTEICPSQRGGGVSGEGVGAFTREDGGPTCGEPHHNQGVAGRTAALGTSTSIGQLAMHVASIERVKEVKDANLKPRRRCAVKYLCATRKRLKFQRFI